MIQHANIPLFVKLTTNELMSPLDLKSWYKTVTTHAPRGTVAHLDCLNIHGMPVQTRMVRRSTGNTVQLLVPMTRDLLPSELLTISTNWRRVSGIGEFTVSSNPPQAQKLNQTVGDMAIPNDEYQMLCIQLAKVQHQGWMRERSQQGWKYGALLSVGQKTHPMMRPWEQLPEQYRDIDTNNPENFLTFLNNQGYAVVKQSELGSLLKILRNLN